MRHESKQIGDALSVGNTACRSMFTGGAISYLDAGSC